MKIEQFIESINIENITYHLLSKYLGNTPLTTGEFDEYISLGSITSNTYQTILLDMHTVESVGNTEILTLYLYTSLAYNGDGSIRFQISGDGGLTWVTIAEGSFNVAIETSDWFGGPGAWLTQISSGTNKLQIKMEALANSGTVDIKMSTAYIDLVYRNVVLY